MLKELIDWLKEHHFIHDWDKWEETAAKFTNTRTGEISTRQMQAKKCKTCGFKKLANVYNRELDQ